MKKGLLAKMTVLTYVVIVSISCSDLPSNEQLTQIISTREKDNILELKNGLTSPCGPGKVLVVPKEFRRVRVHDADANDPFQKIDAFAKKLLDDLAVRDIISMTKTKDGTFVNSFNETVTAQFYDIKLTPNGDKLLIGQTGDDYLLAMIDINDIQIVETTKLATDTLWVRYMAKHNPVFQSMTKLCSENDKSFLPGDTSRAIIIRDNGNWVAKK